MRSVTGGARRACCIVADRRKVWRVAQSSGRAGCGPGTVALDIRWSRITTLPPHGLLIPWRPPMKLRLLVAAVVVLAAAPAAQANDPPYPACSPAKPFTWHAGSRIFATSSLRRLAERGRARGLGAGRRRRDVAARPGPARPTRYVDADPPGRGRERPRGRVPERARRQPVPGPRAAPLHREAAGAARPPPSGRARRRPARVRLPRRPRLPLAGRRRLPLALRAGGKNRTIGSRRRLRAARRRRRPDPRCEGADDVLHRRRRHGGAQGCAGQLSRGEGGSPAQEREGALQPQCHLVGPGADARDPRRDRCDRDRPLPAGLASAVADGGPRSDGRSVSDPVAAVAAVAAA